MKVSECQTFYALLMLVLGIETSCDETGIALYDTEKGLVAHTLYSQIALHAQYGGVVPELASRDHIRRIGPLIEAVFKQTSLSLTDVNAIAYTKGPGLAGTLLVGASVANSLAMALDVPIIGVHHLEGHLLSPLLAKDPPSFPFVALLVSGGHTQLMAIDGIGSYRLLGETLDDAAGEAFDKSAKLLGLSYPGGPEISRLAQQGRPLYDLPRPMLHAKNLNFSFSGLKTAVLHTVQKHDLTENVKCDIARSFVDAIVDVLVTKCLAALKQTRLKQLVIAGGVGANIQLRDALNQASTQKRFRVFYPPLEFCTDNGAMIALAGALHLLKNPQTATKDYTFSVLPRWPLQDIVS